MATKNEAILQAFYASGRLIRWQRSALRYDAQAGVVLEHIGGRLVASHRPVIAEDGRCLSVQHFA